MSHDTAPAADLGEVLRLLALGERLALASRAGALGSLRPPTDRAVGVVLIDDASSVAVGPRAFPVPLKAWVRRRASVAVLAAPEPPAGAVIALAKMLGEGHSIALILTPAARLGAWAAALKGCRIRYASHIIH